MKVEIFTVLKNAEYILPFYLKHYQSNFPGCTINIYDNNSTDNSVGLCLSVGCVIKNFPIYTEYNLRDFKNNIWKESKSDWIIICDVDELVQISQYGLDTLPEEVNIIKFRGYNMVGDEQVEDLHKGFPSNSYDKCCMFKNTFKEINYSIGAHLCTPTPDPIYSDKEFNLYHYNKHWFTYENFLKKFKKEDCERLRQSYDSLSKGVVQLK